MTCVVARAGVVTPIGLSLAETAASARARIARLREINWVDRRFEPYIVGTVPDDGLPPLAAALGAESLQARELRMLRLAHAALADTMLGFEPPQALPLMLALPEHHTTEAINGPRFLARLRAQSRLALDLDHSAAVALGRAGGVMALKGAAQLVESGRFPFVLVGGVDSLVDLYVLGALDLQGRIRGETVSDGFSPSEGAAFLLLTLAETAQNAGLEVLARIAGSACAVEAGHIYSQAPYLGDGLASAFTQLLDSSPPSGPIECIYASFNGERYWARELGTARLRNSKFFAPEAQMEHPAECFGDLGAAFGPALTALAAQGISAGFRRAPCLAYASSDYGDRAAVLLERPA